MPVLRTDIEKALDELASQEEGMRFQGLAVVLGKKRWPELIARQRKKDFGLDAYAPASETPERIGKGLAASITPTLKKISHDAKTAKENFPDLKALLFVTSAKVGNADRKHWEEAIQKDHDLELHIIEREEIITLMMMPENASLGANLLHLDIAPEPQVADLVGRTRRAAGAVTRTWAGKTKGHPLIDLTAVRLDPNGAESPDVLSLEQIDRVLSQGGRIVLEGPAGRGKTTTLVQLAQRARTAGTPFIVELPVWTSSRRRILEYIAGMPAFQAEGLTAADLARVQQTEPFLFLLNGWNEIAQSNSEQATDALREVEREFPGAGIIVATRTYHLTPPLPGALRLRLSRLSRAQRAAYLASRLGAKDVDLHTRIDGDPSLDELTRTPFILSEVASLFEAGAEIPSTKIGVIAEVLRLHEQRDEHRNALQASPIFGRQQDYLTALATAMTRAGAVTLLEADARRLVAVVARELVDRGQIEPAGAPTVLATLTAHHVLERIDYPQTAFQFEHQQLQEYYAALDLRARLLGLSDNDPDKIGFTVDYVNDPAWSEPLRMIAETFSERTGEGETDSRNISSGAKLILMALAVDLVFAGELAQLSGMTVWNEVRVVVGARLRAVYAMRDDNFRHYALAAMLATGSRDFSDIVVPVLSGQDQQTRLRAYRLWPDVQPSTLGPNWRELVRGWSEEARTDFVSELLHHRIDDEIATFAVDDSCIAVKMAAISGLMWTGSDEPLTRVLKSMDEPTFEDVARKNADQMPASMRPKTIAALRRFIGSTTENPARLRAALDLIELGETDLEGVLKDAMATLPAGDMRNLESHYIRPALEYLHKSDPVWVSEWVAKQIADGVLYGHEYWLPLATAIPGDVVEKYLDRLETENLKNAPFQGMAAVIAHCASSALAMRVFAKLRELRRKVDDKQGHPHELEWQVINQLEAVFHSLPDEVAVAGVLSSVVSGDPLDIKVVANLLNRVARPDIEPLHIADGDLKMRLREYLKSSVALVLREDDFSGEEKARLASAIAQVGKPEDIAPLMTLIRADIARMRRGRAAHAGGDRGPLGNGARMYYASWHLAAIIYLDTVGAQQVLIDLLPEPEYRADVATAMAHDFVPKPERAFEPTLRYDLVWAAREGCVPQPADDQRRIHFAAALKSEIERLREQCQDAALVNSLGNLAKALAAVDGRGSAATVLDVIAMSGHRDEYIRVDAAERLLMKGVVLPVTIAFALVDSFFERTGVWVQESDRYLLRRILSLCPFVDDPVTGIAKVRDALGKHRLRGHELRELVTALGESRSDTATDLLYDLASDAQTFEQCEDNFINAFAALDTPRAHELLLGLVDPDISGISLTPSYHRVDLLVARLSELARRIPAIAARLYDLCERDLPEFNRHVLSKVMAWLGTPDAVVANLNLIDDTKSTPVPKGVWDQLEDAFVERRPYGQSTNVFTEHARASNELRIRLLRMTNEDTKRRKSALMLLGQIEEWRLEHGRPTGEPRHPDLVSGQSWPPMEP